MFKSFGGARALDGVSFSIFPGEIHALLGENGAGKTSLMNVLLGLYHADAGTVHINGSEVRLRSPRDAAEHRIGMVAQHFELVQAFTALQNIVLGTSQGRRHSTITKQRAAVSSLAERYGLRVDLDRLVADLEVGNQQKVEILRVLYRGVDVLVLDEPTTHLTPDEADRLFASVRELAADGVAVVLIAHKVREILANADRVTVLRRGRNVATCPAATVSAEELVRLIIGTSADDSVAAEVVTRSVDDARAEPITEHTPSTGRPNRVSALRVECARSKASRAQVVLHHIELDLYPAEIHGIAGVDGNGQNELLELIAGLGRVETGRLILGGRDITATSTRNRLRNGLAWLPSDRIRDGILPDAPIHATYALGLHRSGLIKFWTTRARRSAARTMISDYDVAATNENMPTANLSGGNIQKVLIARALAICSSSSNGVLIAANPANGLDVGASAFVHKKLRELRRSGKSVLLISEDLDELIALSDRISVLEGGTITGCVTRADFDRQRIGALMVAANE